MIKNYILLLTLLLCCALGGKAQVTIGSGEMPDNDALLDLKQQVDGSSNKGLLLPRVSLISLDAPDPMSTFVPGMVVYNTTASNDSLHFLEVGFYISDGSRWIRLEPIEDVVIPTEPWRVAGTSVQATQNTQNIYQNAQVIVGRTGRADSTAQLEISSNERGILIPRLTLRQREAIKNPPESLLIWNSDEGCFNFWKNKKWRSLCGDVGESVITITPANCLSPEVFGNYKVGVGVNNGDYIEVTLQVVEAGTFTIEANTGKGFFYQKTGSFPSAGTYTIQMPAIGTPNEAGTFSFPLTLNGEQMDCSKTVTVTATDAAFEFDCTGNFADNLLEGQSSAGKSIKVNINVTSAGKFNFSTNIVYGVQYTATDLNLTEGTHQIVLYSNGVAPTTAGNNVNFLVSGTGLENSSPCSVSVNILPNQATLTAECGSGVVNGVYKLNITTNTSNFVDIPVTFTTTGTWNAKTDTIDGFSFDGNGSITSIGKKVIRLNASGTPTSAGLKTFEFDINGVTCEINVDVVFPTRNILLIGNTSSAIKNALLNSSNFGVEGVSKIENINIIDGASNPSATSLINLINSNKIDMIIAGWKFSCKDEAAAVIADFIKNKKGYYFQAQGQGLQSALKLILDKAYGVNLTFEGDKFPKLQSVRLPDTSNNIDAAILNGVFGDVRSKYVRSDDDLSWIGIDPSSQSGAIESLVQLPAYNSTVARNTFIYAPGFFMYPDWGMLNYVNSTTGNNSPIGFSTADFKGALSWGGQYGYLSQTIATGNLVNWVLFGNVVNQGFEYIQKNTNKDYQVSTNY